MKQLRGRGAAAAHASPPARRRGLKHLQLVRLALLAATDKSPPARGRIARFVVAALAGSPATSEIDRPRTDEPGQLQIIGCQADIERPTGGDELVQVCTCLDLEFARSNRDDGPKGFCRKGLCAVTDARRVLHSVTSGHLRKFAPGLGNCSPHRSRRTARFDDARSGAGRWRSGLWRAAKISREFRKNSQSRKPIEITRLSRRVLGLGGAMRRKVLVEGNNSAVPKGGIRRAVLKCKDVSASSAPLRWSRRGDRPSVRDIRQEIREGAALGPLAFFPRP